MKYTAATLALVAGLAAAQDNPFGDVIPTCAVSCLTDAIGRVGCTLEDPACACSEENQAAIAGDAEFVGCLTEACSAEEMGQAVAGGAILCEQASGEEPTETDSAAPTETDGADEPTGADESSAAPEPTDDSGADPEPTGGEDGGDDQGGDGGADEGQEGEGEGDGSGAAGLPAVFGGAAILAAVLAI